jgi:hypothetical protein
MVFKLLKKEEPVKETTIDSIKQAVEQIEPELRPYSDIKETIQSKEVYQIVDELPVQVIRKARQDDGTIVNFITKEEATELINARTK